MDSATPPNRCRFSYPTSNNNNHPQNHNNTANPSTRSDLESRIERITKLTGHSGSVLCLDSSTSNEGVLVSGSEDRTSRLWDIRASKQKAVRCFLGFDETVRVITIDSTSTLPLPLPLPLSPSLCPFFAELIY